jgi:hypothetical protein
MADDEVTRLTKYVEIFHLLMITTYFSSAISMMGCGALLTAEYYYSGFPSSNLEQTRIIFVTVGKKTFFSQPKSF